MLQLIGGTSPSSHLLFMTQVFMVQNCARGEHRSQSLALFFDRIGERPTTNDRNKHACPQTHLRPGVTSADSDGAHLCLKCGVDWASLY